MMCSVAATKWPGYLCGQLAGGQCGNMQISIMLASCLSPEKMPWASGMSDALYWKQFCRHTRKFI